MTFRTSKVGPKGQVVIPKAIREELGIRSGELVSVERAGDDVRIRRAMSLDDLLGVFENTPGEGTAGLEREHRDELEREERRARERGA